MDRSGFVVDEHGNRFSSVRDALWRGRLGLDVTDEREAGVEMERLLGYLVSISRKASGRRERLIEVFEEDARMPAFVETWARGQGLLDEDSALTVEGHAAMLMLAVTRDFERGPTPVGPDEVPVAGPDRWRAWGDDTGRFGAAWLTDHLFTVNACGMAEAVGRQEHADSGGGGPP